MKTKTEPTVEENIIRASALAVLMGDTWYPQKNTAWHGWGVEEPTTGKSLWFYYQKGRWQVSVGLPQDRDKQTPFYDEKAFPTPSCSLDANKHPQELLKDIQRRILPDYEPLFAEVKRRVDESNAAADCHDALKAKVEAIVGKKFRPDSHNHGKTEDSMWFGPHNKYDNKVKVEHGKVKIECSFSNEEIGLEILKTIQDALGN